MNHYLSRNWEKTLIFLSGMLHQKKALELTGELYTEVEESSPRWSSYDPKALRCRDLEFIIQCVFENKSLAPSQGTVVENAFSDYLLLGRDAYGDDCRNREILARALSQWLNQETISVFTKLQTLNQISHEIYPLFSSFGLEFSPSSLNYAATIAIVEFIKSKPFCEHGPNVKFIYDFSRGLQDTAEIKNLLEQEFSAVTEAAKVGIFQLYFTALSPTEAADFLRENELEGPSLSYIFRRMGEFGEKYAKELIQLSEWFPNERFFLIPSLAKTKNALAYLLRFLNPRDRNFEQHLVSNVVLALVAVKDEAVTSALLRYLETDYSNNYLVLGALQGRENPQITPTIQNFRKKYAQKYQEQKQIVAKYAQRKKIFGAEHLHAPEELYAMSFVDAYEKIPNE